MTSKFIEIVYFSNHLLNWSIVSRINKMLSTSSQSQSSWMNGEGDHVIAKAEYNFQGSSSDELSFQAGDKIILAPRGSFNTN